jgi:hypothetical protein
MEPTIEAKLTRGESEAQKMVCKLADAMVRCGYTRDGVYNSRHAGFTDRKERGVVLHWSNGKILLSRGAKRHRDGTIVKGDDGRVVYHEPVHPREWTVDEFITVALHLSPFLDSLENGLRWQIYEIPVQEGYVVAPPVWNDNYPAAKNWLAEVFESPQMPGSIRRAWCGRGNGRFRYSVSSLKEGSTIEFGADRLYSSTDGRHRVRWYGEVVRVSNEILWVRHFESAMEMFETIRDRKSHLKEAVS